MGWAWGCCDRTQVGDIALVGETGQVVSDAVVPGDQGAGAGEAYITVGGDESPTGEGGLRLQNEECWCGYEDSKSFEHHGFLLLSLFGLFMEDDGGGWGKVTLLLLFCRITLQTVRNITVPKAK